MLSAMRTVSLFMLKVAFVFPFQLLVKLIRHIKDRRCNVDFDDYPDEDEWIDDEDNEQEIQDEFEAFKKTLNKSENESVEKFIDRVASLIDAKIPDWPSIKEAFVLCLGRSGASSLGSMQIEQLERIIQNQPSDDDAKLRIVYSIETFLGQL